MNRVEIFERGNVSDLENDVNGFLSENDLEPSFQLVDIKFNSYGYGENNTDYHTAMIIYKI